MYYPKVKIISKVHIDENVVGIEDEDILPIKGVVDTEIVCFPVRTNGNLKGKALFVDGRQLPALSKKLLVLDEDNVLCLICVKNPTP